MVYIYTVLNSFPMCLVDSDPCQEEGVVPGGALPDRLEPWRHPVPVTSAPPRQPGWKHQLPGQAAEKVCADLSFKNAAFTISICLFHILSIGYALFNNLITTFWYVCHIRWGDINIMKVIIHGVWASQLMYMNNLSILLCMVTKLQS